MALSLGLAAAGGLHAQAPAGINDAADIKEMMRVETEIQTTESVDVMMSNVAREEVLADMFAPGWYRGWQTVYDAMAPQYDEVASNVPVPGKDGSPAREFNFLSDGKLACTMMNIKLDQKLANGTNRVIAFRQMDMLSKRGDKWFVHQSNVGFAFDEMTGKAIKDADLPVYGESKWSPGIVPAAAPATPADLIRARAELRDWLDGRSTATTVEQLMPFFAGSDAIVYGLGLPGEYRGEARIRAYFAPRLAGVKAISNQVVDFLVETDGRMGTITARQNIKTILADGTVRNMFVRHSACLRRAGGKWQAVMDQTTVPMDRKTGVAVTDMGAALGL